MKKSFLKKFKKISFSKMVKVNTKINADELIPTEVDNKKLELIEPNLLKNEYVEKIKDNEIVVSNTKNTYSVKFYDKLILITEILNNHTQLGKRTVNYYIKEIA